jgi:hypothetical protein
MPIQPNELDYIKKQLCNVRDRLFDEHINSALYNIGYLMCMIDKMNGDDDPEEDRDYEKDK